MMIQGSGSELIPSCVLAVQVFSISSLDLPPHDAEVLEGECCKYLGFLYEELQRDLILLLLPVQKLKY